jgi:hypothetical protein
MTIGSVREGDMVRCDVRGDRFWAIVLGDVGDDKKIPIGPLNGRPIPSFRVGARQVVGHWRKRKGSAL